MRPDAGHRKVGFKARHGRRRNPVAHKGHRKARSGSRFARILKAVAREACAPQIGDWR